MEEFKPLAIIYCAIVQCLVKRIVLAAEAGIKDNVSLMSHYSKSELIKKKVALRCDSSATRSTVYVLTQFEHDVGVTLKLQTSKVTKKKGQTSTFPEQLPVVQLTPIIPILDSKRKRDECVNPIHVANPSQEEHTNSKQKRSSQPADLIPELCRE